jgi:hypothetical protein
MKEAIQNIFERGVRLGRVRQGFGKFGGPVNYIETAYFCGLGAGADPTVRDLGYRA